MELTAYTTYSDIRAVLGVSSDDLEDSTLSLDVYAFNLEAEFDELDPLILPAYGDLRESDPEGMEPAQRRFFQACRTFSTYAVAKQCLTALPLAAPKEHSDGKASVTRFALDPYKETIRRVESAYEKMRERLLQAFAGLQATTRAEVPLPVLFLASGLPSDPVTGT